MNVVRELVTLLRYKVDNSPLKAYATQAQTAAKGIRAKVDGAFSAVRNQIAIQAKLNRYHKNFAESAEIYRNKLKGVNNELNEAKGKLLALRSLMGGYFAMVAGGSAMKIADDWAAVDSRVKLATKSVEDHQHALKQIFDISQRSGQDYLASADLFSKVNRSADDLGLSLDDSLNLTEIIGQTMTIGGGDQGAQEAALMQLGQALGSGALRGDELNSIIEQAPRLASAIADSFGVPIGQLKELGSKGKLTSKELAQGLLKQAEKIQQEFDQMPKTFGRGMTILKNKAGQLIDMAVNKVSKLGAAFYEAAHWVTENIRFIGFLASTVIAVRLVSAINATKKSLKQLILMGARAAAPYLAMAAAAAAVSLVLEDIYAWIQGDLSLTGALVGRFDQWAAKFNVLGDMARLLWSNIKDIAAALGSSFGFDIDFKSWQEFATGALQYVINGLGNVLEFLLNISRFVKRLIKGDFVGAFDAAGEAVSGLSLKFLPFYSLALSALGGVLSLLWALFSPMKLFNVAAFGVTKAFKLSLAVIKPFVPILNFIGKTYVALPSKIRQWRKTLQSVATKMGTVQKGVMSLGRAFLFVSKSIIRAIWSIARAMLAAMISNPILAAITLILGAIALIVVYWDDIKRVALAVWDEISTKAAEIWDSITQSATEMWDNISTKAGSIWEGVKNTAIEKWNSVTSIFKNAWQESINTVVGWFDSLIPSWIKKLFSDGAKAEVNVTGATQAPVDAGWSVSSGAALMTPTSSYASPTGAISAGARVTNQQATVNQTNNFTIQSSASPNGVANAVASKIGKSGPNPFGLGQIEYAG